MGSMTATTSDIESRPKARAWAATTAQPMEAGSARWSGPQMACEKGEESAEWSVSRWVLRWAPELELARVHEKEPRSAAIG